MTSALIIVFGEPQPEDVAETLLGQFELIDLDDDQGESIEFHVEHASIGRLDKLYADLLNDDRVRPTLTEAAATMQAAATFVRELHGEELPAKELKSALDELAGAVRRLRAVTS